MPAAQNQLVWLLAKTSSSCAEQQQNYEASALNRGSGAARALKLELW